MQVEGEKKQDIEIRVSPKIYSEKRLEKEFQKARKELAKVISGENKDLSHIKTDLDLVTALDDFPFSVSWELSRYDVMDSLGRLDQEKIREEDPENQGIGMNITGVLHYEDKVYPCEMDLVIFAGQEKTLSTKERVLELVRSQDSATRQKAYLTLPPSLDGRKIAWTEEKDSKVIPILMLGMAISILLVGREIQKENNQKKTRKEQMMLDYPEIITEFTMLTGAGMTAKNVWKRIAEDYGITRGKTGRKREAYEEIWKTWQEMKSGIPEMECYERFARRCDLIPYMKMGALLSQNLKKGAKGISSYGGSTGTGGQKEQGETAGRRGRNQTFDPNAFDADHRDYDRSCTGIFVDPGVGGERMKAVKKKLWTGWIRIQKILTEKDGISTVELILVLVVIIGLVIIFKKQLNELVTKIFEKITNESSGI